MIPFLKSVDDMLLNTTAFTFNKKKESLKFNSGFYDGLLVVLAWVFIVMCYQSRFYFHFPSSSSN